MIDVRPFDTLGAADRGGLKARHHFSFARYFDPARVAHGSLRAWNDDEIAPNAGFPPRPHAEVDIVTYVREGAITHEDDRGNHGRIEAGDVQVMSAGSGLRHAEYNLEDEPARLFRIWIEAREDADASDDGKPYWGQKPFPREPREREPRERETRERESRARAFVPLASGFEGDMEALPIRARARVLGAALFAGEVAEYRLGTKRHAYLVSAKGAIEVNGLAVNERDGVALAYETVLVVKALEDAEIVLVDAP